ncbi:MAG: O-antigen ligase family protein [Paraglaciecola polaris]|uniref:O-antigen ligase family protein n=1 Tax=Paraglaciecola polaris TaxID=222814 RepID=UPI003001E449
MRDIVVLLISLVFILAAMTSRFAGAIGYWWFGIFRPQDWVWGNINTLKLPLIAIVLFIIPCLLQGIWPRFKDTISKMLLVYLILTLLTQVVSSCSPIGFRTEYLQQFCILLFAIFLTIRVVDTEQRFCWLIALVGFSLAFHAAKAGLLGMLGMGGTYYGAATMTGLFQGSNGFAFGSAVLLFFNIFVIRMAYTTNALTYLPSLVRKEITLKMIKWVGPIVCLGIIYNVITLFSRGSALAMFIGLVIWLSLSKLLKFKYVFIFVIAGVLAFSIVGLPEGYEERLASSFVDEEELDGSAASRPHFWGIAMDMVADNPLGVGPGCYNTYYNIYDGSFGKYGYYRTVHSAHFEVLSEIGYLGLLCWLLLYIVSIIKLFKIRKAIKSFKEKTDRDEFFMNAANLLIVSIIVFFIGSSFYAQSYNDIIWLLWGMTAALVTLFEKHTSAVELSRKESNDY